MELEKFNTIVRAQIQQCFDTLELKNREYTFGNDRLEHFKNTAIEHEITPRQALWGMASKHITSISSMCKNNINNTELWTEKITDSINYLLLLQALITEECENE